MPRVTHFVPALWPCGPGWLRTSNVRACKCSTGTAMDLESGIQLLLGKYLHLRLLSLLLSRHLVSGVQDSAHPKGGVSSETNG